MNVSGDSQKSLIIKAAKEHSSFKRIPSYDLATLVIKALEEKHPSYYWSRAYAMRIIRGLYE